MRRGLAVGTWIMAALVFASLGMAQTKAIQKSQEWFQDSRFGLFVHWGVYSLLSKGEWVMNNDRMTVEDYEKLHHQFNPVNFDADQWVRLAKDAGMKYITITSKHHDGFSMYDTQLNDYKITKTPFKRDPMKELAAACDKHGLRLFFYYSQLDWRHPDYFPRGKTGNYTGRPIAGEWDRYIDVHMGQVRELCTNYGEIGGLWFDGWWDRPEADWRLDELYSMIHELQPSALIGNNHHVEPFAGENFQNFEQDLPGDNTAGFNKAGVSQLPLETCLTMNGSWGYNKNDNDFKSTRELIHYLVKAAGFGSNLLLNVGPTPLGEIQPEAVTRLKEMGAWLDRYGKTIYKTRGGPWVRQPWGTSTQKDKNTIYLHVLESPQGMITLPLTDSIVKSAKLWKGKKLKVIHGGKKAAIILPQQDEDPIDAIIELTMCESKF